MATKPEPKAPRGPSTSAAPRSLSAGPSWWQRLRRWLGSPVRLRMRANTPAEELVVDAMRRVRALTAAEGRRYVSLDDLFLTLVIDQPLRTLLRQHGTSAEDLVSDVRQALATVDPLLDRSAIDPAGAAKEAAPAVHQALLSAAFHQGDAGGDDDDDDDVNGRLDSVLLFLGCLTEGPPSFVRESFAQRTGKRRFDVVWPLAHGDVDDDDEPARTPMAALVVYNDHFTTQEFVCDVLARHTDLVDDEAQQLMWSVHAVGLALILTAPVETIRSMRRAIAHDARAHGHPLRVRVEPLTDEG